MEAPIFSRILEAKEAEGMSWDGLAERVNDENGTNFTGEQIKDWVRKRKIPVGGFLAFAVCRVLTIKAMPKSFKSFKDGGIDE